MASANHNFLSPQDTPYVSTWFPALGSGTKKFTTPEFLEIGGLHWRGSKILPGISKNPIRAAALLRPLDGSLF